MLIPRTCRLIPTARTRQTNYEIVTRNPPERFDGYVDWFYFIHVDPVQRVIHLVGMLVGVGVFARSFLALVAARWLAAAGLYLVGVFFFYGFGVISHAIYDRGAAESDPAYWHLTLPAVVYINLCTLIGRYDWILDDLMARYPFTRAEWDLVEVTPAQLAVHLLRGGETPGPGATS